MYVVMLVTKQVSYLHGRISVTNIESNISEVKNNLVKQH